MSALLDKSLDELRKPKRSDGSRRSRGGSSRSSSFRENASPYARPNSSSTSDQDAWQHDMYDQPQESTRQPRRRAAASSDEASNKLKIENLHYEVSEAELDSLFSQMGELEKPPTIQFDRSGRSEGIATVIFKNEDDAVKAKECCNGANAKGQPIIVTYDHSWRKPKEAPELLSRLKGGEDLFKSEPSRGSFRARASAPRIGFAGRGMNRGRGGGSNRGRGGSGSGSRSAPKSAEDLDKELDSFMTNDVEMS